MTFVLYMLALAGAGMGSGVLAGLFGIGAGSLMVPLLVFYFSLRGVDLAAAGLLAVATSLTAITALSARAFWSHHRQRVGDLKLVLAMAPGGIMGALLGAAMATRLGGKSVILAFAAFEVIIGLQLWRNRQASSQSKPVKVSGAALLTGFAAGSLATFFGVGGGVIAVPLQMRFLGLGIHQAIANSSGLIVFNALIGSIRYGLANAATLPLTTIGYIDPQAALALGLGGLLGAPLGVRLAHRLAADKLKKLFGLFLIAVGLGLALKAI